jgi:hypothetical protein
MKYSYINHRNVIFQKTSDLIGTAAEPQTSDLSQDNAILLFKKSIAVMKHKDKEQGSLRVISQIYSLLLCIHYSIHFCGYKATVMYDKRSYLLSSGITTCSLREVQTLLQLKMLLLSSGYHTMPEHGGSKLL